MHCQDLCPESRILFSPAQPPTSKHPPYKPPSPPLAVRWNADKRQRTSKRAPHDFPRKRHRPWVAAYVATYFTPSTQKTEPCCSLPQSSAFSFHLIKLILPAKTETASVNKDCTLSARTHATIHRLRLVSSLTMSNAPRVIGDALEPRNGKQKTKLQHSSRNARALPPQ